MSDLQAHFFDADLPPSVILDRCQRELGLAKVALVDEKELWSEEIASLPRDIRATHESPEWRWVIYPWRSMAVRVPDQATYWAIVTSRNYPIVTRWEQARLQQSTILLAGLSTGRAVAQQLARLGVGRLVLADADKMSTSNFNRLVGGGLPDLALPKVVSVRRELQEFNPYLEVIEHGEFLDERSTAALLDAHRVDVVVEMIDNIDAKLAIRRAARQRGLSVIMATDMDWDPYVDIEEPTRPLFNGRLDEREISAFADPQTEFRAKTQLVMKFMGLKTWADRSMLSGQLASAGLIDYWSQTAPAASTAGALAARAVFDLIRGRTDLPARATVSLRDPMGTSDAVDDSEPLVMQLRDTSTQRS